MASKQIVTGMLKLFCQIWTNKPLTDELFEAYYHALKKYSDDNVKEAGYKCLDECEFFPKLIDVSKRIRDIQRQSDGHFDGQDCKFSNNAKCVDCGKVGFCIKEPKDTGQWKCRQCYSGLTQEEFQQKLNKIFAILEGKKGSINLKPDKAFRENREIIERKQELYE